MLIYRLGTVNDCHWEFKSVLSYSKPHTFSTFFGEGKERTRKSKTEAVLQRRSMLKLGVICRFMNCYGKCFMS